MTIPIITHNHDGIRINIDGVVSCFANAVYLADDSIYKFSLKAVVLSGHFHGWRGLACCASGVGPGRVCFGLDDDGDVELAARF